MLNNLLESEMRERVRQYRQEADLLRMVRRQPLRARIARTLRRLADRVEPHRNGGGIRLEQGPALLYGRKD